MRPAGHTLPKTTDNSDMYNRAFPVGNALFLFTRDMMSLFRLPRGKLPLTFLTVPAGKDGWVECPCQTVNDFIRVRGSVCGLFLFSCQTQGRGCFPPCTCGWWLVDGLQVPVVMRFFHRSAFLQTVPYMPYAV